MRTPEALADLQHDWAELAKRQGFNPENFHACTRNGKPWQEDAASVRSLAAMLSGRGLPGKRKRRPVVPTPVSLTPS